MKHLIFVHSLLSLIVAAVLLVIAALGCAVPAAALTSGAGALIRAEWEQIVDGEALPWVYTLASDDHTLYAGGRGGLYISEDDGHVWRQTLEPGVRSLAISANDVYAGTAYHGVFRSTNRGNTWERKNVGLPAQLNGKRPAIQQILITSSGRLIALTYDNGSFVSHNRGTVWHDQSDNWGIGERSISRGIRSMIEFDGYLWAYLSTGWIVRALSERIIWDSVKWFERGQITDLAVVGDELYAAGVKGFGRWNEVELGWEYFSDGLPTGSYSPHVTTLEPIAAVSSPGWTAAVFTCSMNARKGLFPQGCRIISSALSYPINPIYTPQSNNSPTVNTRSKASTAPPSQSFNRTAKPPPPGAPLNSNDIR